MWVVRVGWDDGELRLWHYIYVYSIASRLIMTQAVHEHARHRKVRLLQIETNTAMHSIPCMLSKTTWGYSKLRTCTAPRVVVCS